MKTSMDVYGPEPEPAEQWMLHQLSGEGPGSPQRWDVRTRAGHHRADRCALDGLASVAATFTCPFSAPSTRSRRAHPPAARSAQVQRFGLLRGMEPFDDLTGQLCDEFEVLVDVEHGAIGQFGGRGDQKVRNRRGAMLAALC